MRNEQTNSPYIISYIVLVDGLEFGAIPAGYICRVGVAHGFLKYKLLLVLVECAHQSTTVRLTYLQCALTHHTTRLRTRYSILIRSRDDVYSFFITSRLKTYNKKIVSLFTY